MLSFQSKLIIKVISVTKFVVEFAYRLLLVDGILK